MKALSVVLAAALVAPLSATAGSMSPDHPDALICQVEAKGDMPALKMMLFLSALGDDGSSLYQSLGTTSVTIAFGPDGSRAAPDSNTCDGKTLPELVDAGMTKDF